MKYDFHLKEQPQVNVLPGRAYYVPFDTENVSDDRNLSKQFLNLTDWKFAYFDDFTDAVFDAEGVDDVVVPSNWQYLGYSNACYINHKYPYPYTPGKIYGKTQQHRQVSAGAAYLRLIPRFCAFGCIRPGSSTPV